MSDDSFAESALTCVGGLTLAAVALPAAYLIDGLALRTLWGWFVAPEFRLPELGLAEAIGLGVVAGYLTHQYVPSKDGDKVGPWVDMFLGPLVALIIGAIVHHWFM